MPDEASTLILSRSHESCAVGSVVWRADCGHSCWIAPSGLTMLKDSPDTTTRCIDCFGGYERMVTTMATEQTYRAPGALEEVRREIGDHDAAVFGRLTATFRRDG